MKRLGGDCTAALSSQRSADVGPRGRARARAERPRNYRATGTGSRPTLPSRPTQLASAGQALLCASDRATALAARRPAVDSASRQHGERGKAASAGMRRIEAKGLVHPRFKDSALGWRPITSAARQKAKAERELAVLAPDERARLLAKRRVRDTLREMRELFPSPRRRPSPPDQEVAGRRQRRAAASGGRARGVS